MEMGIHSQFAWFIFVPMVLGSDSDNIKHIWCTDEDVRSQRNLIKGLKAEEMLCEAVPTTQYPWTTDDPELTPVAPESMRAEYRTYRTKSRNNSREIAVYVSWKYRSLYFKHVENFHIELNFIRPPGDQKQFMMNWDENLTNVVDNSSAIYLQFHFIYSGKHGNYHIQSGDRYRFRLQPVPLYQEDQHPQDAVNIITIPGCDNKNISKTYKCKKQSCANGHERRKGRCRRIKTTGKLRGKHRGLPVSIATDANDQSTLEMSAEQQGNAAVHIILLMIGGLVIVIIAAIFLCVFKRRITICYNGAKQQPSTKIQRRVLLVCTTDSRFSDPINQMIGILKKFPGLEVICNLQLKNEIGRLGIQSWTAKYINDADAIAFLVANGYHAADSENEETENSRLNNMEQHQVGIVVKAAEAIFLKQKEKNEQTTVIIADLMGRTKKEDAPYFTHLMLPDNFKKFLKAVTGTAVGEYVSKKDRNLFESYLCIARDNGRVKVMNGEDDGSIEVDDEKQQSLKIDKGQNDLNLSLFSSLHVEEKSCSLNIPSDGPPSCESNQPQCYVTSDFNNDTSRSGAIPKVSC